jgi:iron(III) transport system ATP-binding protein
MSATPPSLLVSGLSKLYRNTGDGVAGGIQDASFSLEPGTFFTLLGPSGCGKTTTLRCIAGLEEPDAGSIAVGRDVFFDAARGISVPLNRREIGMVFQSYAIWPHMSVFENVAFPLRVAKDRAYSREETKRLVGDALSSVDLDGFGARSATQLSGGQQQRVALARAIVRQPKLLLLDEPLSNLDAALREGMRNELKRLQRQLGITTVYVTHDQAEALEMSDTIAVLNRGRIVQMGSPREIYFRPSNAFVAGFVGTTNLLHGVVEDVGSGLVRLTDGAALRCVLPDQAGAGQAIAVSVRPEMIDLLAAKALGRADSNRMTGRVVHANFIGNMTRYGVRVGERMMQAYAPPTAGLSVDDDVTLEFAVDAAIGVPI